MLRKAITILSLIGLLLNVGGYEYGAEFAKQERSMPSIIAEITFIPTPPGTPWSLITIMGLFALGLILMTILLLRRKR